jgi:hypothetical protein
MSFEINETVILTDKASKGLPMRVGSLAKIINILHTSVNYDYDIQFSDGEIAPVRECELRKLSDVHKKYLEYIYVGNKVGFSDTEVKIIKVDYCFGTAEIEFDDQSSGVEYFERLYPIKVKENDSVVESISRSDKHRQVIEEIHTTFKIKNADYGNSFGEQFEEYGILSAVIRLDDKMRRLKQLMKQEAQVKDESIRDTVLDMANYAIMTVMELDGLND